VGAIVVVVLGVGLQAIVLFQLRGDLETGRSALEAARRHALAGDLDAAGRSLDVATGAFTSAANRSRGPLGTMARTVPWLGNSADAAAAMADAGVGLSRAGSTVVDAIASLPGGIAALAPRGGTLPLDRYDALAPTIAAAADQASSAAAVLAGAPDTFMPGSLASARWDAESQASRLARNLDGIGMLLRGARAFGGGEGPRRYLVLAQNPAELRGTGGIWGAYAIVTMLDGHVTISPSRPTQTLRDFPAGRVPSPSADYSRNYDQYGGAGSWQNMNATPDFPSAAQAALANYALGEGEHLDGVLAVDPFALQGLLAVTGPIDVPGVGTITADNVVAYTTHRAYTTLDHATQRKEILGAVATRAVVRFLGMDEHAIARLRAIGDAFGAGHLLLDSTDPDIQGGLATLGIDGSFAAPDGDILDVTVNNGSGSKIDFYAERTVTDDVQLGGNGEALSTVTVSIANTAPTTGQPPYVIGPFIAGARAGDQVPITSVACHDPCTLQEADRDGQPIEVAAGSEKGVAWLRDYRTIGAGTTGTLSLAWRSAGVWSGSSSGGSYRLTVRGQPTARPTQMTVTIHAPAGTDIVWTSEPMAVDGGTAIWTGTPSGATDLMVRFQAPLPLRIVRDLTRPFLGSGAIGSYGER
jgi:hypothetical protein